MKTTTYTATDLVLCTSADGWSLHAPGSTDDAIASGDAPYLVSGSGRPADADFAAALAKLAQDGGPNPYEVADRVEGGENAEDYGTGRVLEIDGDMVTVAWDSGVSTSQHHSLLRPQGEPSIERTSEEG